MWNNYGAPFELERLGVQQEAEVEQQGDGETIYTALQDAKLASTVPRQEPLP